MYHAKGGVFTTPASQCLDVVSHTRDREVAA